MGCTIDNLTPFLLQADPELMLAAATGQRPPLARQSEKATQLAQRLGQLQPFTAVFAQECMD